MGRIHGQTTKWRWLGGNIAVGQIRIPQNDTVRIVPGSRFNFVGGGKIIVEGSLIARGNSENRIEFHSGERYEGGTGDFIYLHNSDYTTFQQCDFRGGVEISISPLATGKIKISECTFRVSQGIRISSSTEIKIWGCLFTENNFALTFDPSAWGHLRSPPDQYNLLIRNNAIYKNNYNLGGARKTWYNVLNRGSLPVNLENNWWGTTNADSIDFRIFDDEEWDIRSEVDFLPFLNSDPTN